MKNMLWLLALCIAQISFYGCDHEKLPSVSTGVITDITATSATVSGTVLDDGADITVRGFCYSSTDSLPSVDGLHTTDGSGSGVFTSSIAQLAPNTTYYVRAYALNDQGTAYGNTVTFRTLDETDPTLSPYTQMLCNPNGWILSQAISTPAYLLMDGTFITNLFDGYFGDFEIDDILVFNTDGTITANPGNIIPDDWWLEDYGADDFPFTTSVIGDWHFDNEENPDSITMQIPFFYDRTPEVCEILSLSSNEFVINCTVYDNYDENVYTFTLHYVPANSEQAAKIKAQRASSQKRHTAITSRFKVRKNR